MDASLLSRSMYLITFLVAVAIVDVTKRRIPNWLTLSAAIVALVLNFSKTGSDGALMVAERIRERIAAHSFLSADQLDVRLTASVGIATLPDVAASAEELVQAADRAMYTVKVSGKNGIHLAAE